MIPANISSPETEKIFQDKMREIELQEKEKSVFREAHRLGLDYIDFKKIIVSPEALILISKKESQEAKIICFFVIGREARVGILDPENKKARKIIENLKKNKNLEVKIFLISEHSLQKGLEIYEKIPKLRKIIKGVEIKAEDLEKFKIKIKTFKDLDREIQKTSVTDFLSLVIASAMESRASDIHIEAEEEIVKIRFRVDGVLHDVASVDKNNWSKIISRVKLIAGLKININKKPQDGRFSIFLTEEELDVRISTLPTNQGESAVIRLFRSSAASLKLEDLGLQGKAFEQVLEQVKRPNGMVIATGPTGSGKTTTLYAVLNKINKPDVKIITLEDPIEYKLEGITQSQIDQEGNYTFANGLKSILRQDPDVIMVGEIRDLETAEITIQAALTGHFVVSTLHTNDSAGALPRLLALGIKPFLIAPALNAILGQRLVRRLCPKCKEEIKLDEAALKKIKTILSAIPKEAGVKINLEKLKFYQSKGCPACQGLGYKGRIGIFEVFLIDSETEKIILKSEISEYSIREIALKNGMITMAQDGLLKALDGVTSVEEIFRVIA